MGRNSLASNRENMSMIVRARQTWKDYWDNVSKPESSAIQEVVSVAGYNAGQGLVVGSLLGSMSGGNPLSRGSQFAVLLGTSSGLQTALRRIRKKEDYVNSIVSGLGTGIAYNIVQGMPTGFSGALSSGFAFGAFSGLGSYLFSSASAVPHDPEYRLVRQMLKDLNFTQYEASFFKAQLKDICLPLLTDSALQEIRVPAGPRLLMLDYARRMYRKTGPSKSANSHLLLLTDSSHSSSSLSSCCSKMGSGSPAPSAKKGFFSNTLRLTRPCPHECS
eukprot:TRINITY_DN19637_c0_g1::TRINITY_DN19637_c0_g1_i1::g.3245::m.3245 TRINITY_DN19637_c0_g1::TRINITY_DN19637_c0_g1_i1::g.3245  ORF type:complete len:275 (+),score=26.96,Tim17/PF02466.14/4.1e+02,Tim17/PF02466.14/1.5e-08,SAM_1/PF00536.25/0.0011,Gly-zipper_OmpA/PF13436.1/7,Gly-zipper_OmpA/PF13436.1/54 TRINITY_DN19637_c0_g1_i1:3-827(+)